MIDKSGISAATADLFGMTAPHSAQEAKTDHYLIADVRTSLFIQSTNVPSDELTTPCGHTHAQLLIVADAVGGKSAECASRIAVDVIPRGLLSALTVHGIPDEGGKQRFVRQVTAALEECRTCLQEGLDGQPPSQEAGTAVTLAYVIWPWLYLGHVGDCRCYLFRNSRLKKLTTDHTFAQRMVESGIIEAEQATGSRWNSVLWNVVSAGAAEFHPEISVCELFADDALLLCTDGLTRCLSHGQIATLLNEDQSSEATCKRLIDAAGSIPANEDATAVVARFRSLESLDPAGEHDCHSGGKPHSEVVVET